MKRQDKYPDTKVFHFYNANPKGKYTGDCVVRALCTALEESYEKVSRDLLENALRTGYSFASKDNFDNYLKSRGWVKQPQPRKDDNTKYTGEEFCLEIQSHRNWYNPQIIANIGGGHVVAIMFGEVYDTWDSTDGCIGNYWERK